MVPRKEEVATKDDIVLCHPSDPEFVLLFHATKETPPMIANWVF